MTDYFAICIREFVKRYNRPLKMQCCIWMSMVVWIFLEEFYNVKHTLFVDDTVAIKRRNIIMILFHRFNCNIEIFEIDFAQCKIYKDFGVGYRGYRNL